MVLKILKIIPPKVRILSGTRPSLPVCCLCCGRIFSVFRIQAAAIHLLDEYSAYPLYPTSTECFSLNCKMHLSKLSNVFVQNTKCIYPNPRRVFGLPSLPHCTSTECISSNCKMYFSKSHKLICPTTVDCFCETKYLKSVISALQTQN